MLICRWALVRAQEPRRLHTATTNNLSAQGAAADAGVQVRAERHACRTPRGAPVDQRYPSEAGLAALCGRQGRRAFPVGRKRTEERAKQRALSAQRLIGDRRRKPLAEQGLAHSTGGKPMLCVRKCFDGAVSARGFPGRNQSRAVSICWSHAGGLDRPPSLVPRKALHHCKRFALC